MRKDYTMVKDNCRILDEAGVHFTSQAGIGICMNCTRELCVYDRRHIYVNDPEKSRGPTGQLALPMAGLDARSVSQT